MEIISNAKPHDGKVTRKGPSRYRYLPRLTGAGVYGTRKACLSARGRSAYGSHLGSRGISSWKELVAVILTPAALLRRGSAARDRLAGCMCLK